MSTTEDTATAENVNLKEDIDISDDFVMKSERDIKRELIDLTVIDDSEIGKNDTTNTRTDTDMSKNYEDLHVSTNEESTEIKQEKSSQTVKSPETKCQAVEHDSLILTADDADLDNEMFSIVSSDKDSPRKPQKIASAVDHDSRKHKQDATDTTVKVDKMKLTKCPEDKHKDDQNKSSKTRTSSSDPTSKNSCRALWVINISKSLKASNLKQYFSKHGKVVTAKVVTDGKNFYGYVSFEKREDAERCMRKLDGTSFEEKKLKLSFTRPNQDMPSTEKKGSEIHRRNSTDSKAKKKIDNSDPLTTKFTTTGKFRSSRTRTKSRSPSHRERQLERDYLREKREAERLKRRILEQEERNRLERQRQKQREEEQRELEWKLKLQRKQLQIEREMFEKERKEVIRLDEERRRIEEERLGILKEKAKLKEELRLARKSESKKRAEVEKDDEKRHKLDVKSKVCEPSYNKNKSEDHYGGRYRKESPRAPPPPPKLSETPKSKMNRNYDSGIHRRDEDLKKNERDYRKIETIHRERRPDPQGRRDRFLARNQQRDGGFSQQEPWKTSFIGKPWEVDQHSSNARYEPNCQTSGSYSTGYYYHTPSSEDYSRYQQYNVHLDRKY